MILTEEEAKTKWCPHVRQSDGIGEVATNRWDEDNNPAYARCIASECMAWEWATKPNPDFKECNMWPDQRARHEMDRTLPDHERGYCGLSGKPND